MASCTPQTTQNPHAELRSAISRLGLLIPGRNRGLRFFFRFFMRLNGRACSSSKKKWLMAGRQFQCPFTCPLPIVPWWLCQGATGAPLAPTMAVELPDMTTSRALKKLCAMRRRLADTVQLRGVRSFAEGICITTIRACLDTHDWGPRVQ
jgi:hypothetical protein